ncbi:MAG: ABC transporter ATP-binding protein, partial [Acaryochloridaceae cyanobacterium CSU_3_4]|nr:ABC transporter ATP-binding protein [Acaryochloridaceae cyanobacterium CSU_3_4]
FLRVLGEFLTLTKQSEVSFERMQGLLNCSAREMVAHRPLYLPTVRGRQPSLPRLRSWPQPSRLQSLTAQNLTYHYPGTRCGITDISLQIQRGRLTVITGPVGSGKSTLLRVLLGLLPLQTGTLAWNGQAIEHPANFLIPPRVAYTPQVPHLFSSTLRDNILLGMDCSDAEVMAAIALAALDSDLAALPEGLDTPIGANGMHLSGGQAQRTAAARMLVRQSELLVFDDLSSALDVETEKILWSRLLANASTSADHSSQTYLIVSHRPNVLEQADQIIVLDCGHVEFKGQFQDLPRNYFHRSHARTNVPPD